jgi:hypothetical protein
LIGNINGCSQKIINTNFQYQPLKENELKGYKKYIESNKIYPESKAQSLFSGMTKSYSKGKCPFCGIPIENYSFNYFIDQSIYLDDFDYYEYKFLDILRGNYNNYIDLTMDCPGCNEEIKIKEETKIIKLPDILIFTLERYQGEKKNKIIIKPDKKLNMNEFIDKNVKVDSTEYELFAINIRFGSTANFGHEICQVMRNGKWYQINDSYGNKINDISYFDSSYGLFYRKIKNKDKDNKYSYEKLKKINDKNSERSESFFNSFLDLFSSIFHSKNKKDLIYIKQGFYILSEANILNNKSLYFYPKKIHLLSLIEGVISKIKDKNKYDANLFIEEFLTINRNYDEKKEFSSLDFIKVLINNLKNEYIKNNCNLLYENNIKYFPINDKEKNEYIKFKEHFFPQTPFNFIFSSIIKINIKGQCKCGQEINEYKFEDFISKNILLDEINSDIYFFKILKNFFSIKYEKRNCINCKKKRIKLSVEKKFMKLGDILIFSLINSKNNTKIIPSEIIDLQNFIDKNNSFKDNQEKYKYELFAINCKINFKESPASLITKIKIDETWYEISDDSVKKSSYHSEDIISLFYRKKI